MTATRGLAVGVLAIVLAACTPAPPETPPTSALVRAGEDGSIPANGSISLHADHAAIRGLDPALLEALRNADVEARQAGVELKVTSGWRSRQYQQRLLDEAVVTYGSLDEARRFVNTPEKSTHVSGKAVDIGPTAADDWLIQHGADHGLCQAYANEMWHFELLASPGGTCPMPLVDAAG
ncbi:MAG: M15 family metallopeptidase [Umezawaea sp.]